MRKLAFLTLLLTLVIGTGFAQTETTPPQDPAAQPQASQPANPDQTQPADQQAPAADQSATQSTDQNGETLPQTASPLPLIGLLGLGSLVAGVVARKRK